MKKSIKFILLCVMFFVLVGCENKKNIDETSQIDEIEAINENLNYDEIRQNMSNFVGDSPYFVKDGWIYMMSFPEEGGLGFLAKMRTDGTEFSSLMTKGAPYYINVDGEFVYAILSGEDNSTKLYRCRLGGQDAKQLISDDILGLQIVDDYLYYNKYDTTKNITIGYYRCDKNGENEELLLDKEIYYSFIVGDRLYYQDDNDGETVHCYNLKNKQDEKITNGLSYSFVLDEKNAFYLKNDKSTTEGDFVADLVKINLSTREETVLYEGASTEGILVSDTNIYFINSNDSNRIYSIDKNGENIKLISQDNNCTRLGMFNNSLLYTVRDSDGYISEIYMCNLDGSDKISIIRFY